MIFGTGYFSPFFLEKSPYNDLKKDRSFIQELEEREEASKEIVKTTIALANTSSLGKIAEGVETEGQFSLLKNLECDCPQS